MESIPATVASEQPKSWRNVYKVHPAADAFPMLPEDELRKLGEDIKANGLKEPIILWVSETKECQVIDGRNRLDAMERVGIDVLNKDKDDSHVLKIDLITFLGKDDPYTFVISKNIRRRHLTKEQQADLIVKVIKAAESDFAKIAKSETRQFPGGAQGGSSKDRAKEKIVKEGAKHGIGTRTMEKAIAKAKGPTQKPRVKTPDAPPPQKIVATPPVVKGDPAKKVPWNFDDALLLITVAIEAQMKNAPDRKERYRLAVEIRRLGSKLQDKYTANHSKSH
jgi:hypothetical protein